MKKFKYVLFWVLLCVIPIAKVFAECDVTEESELLNAAYKVVASYEEMEEEADPDTYNPPDGLTEEEVEAFVLYDNYFNVYISNLTENLYIEVTDKNSGKTKKYTYDDSQNGTITIRQSIYEKNSFSIAVFSNSSNCKGKRLRSLDYSTPVFNPYSISIACINIPEYYLCRRYVDYDVPEDENEFQKLTWNYINAKKEKEKSEEEKNQKKGFWNYLKENKGAIIIISITILIIGGGVIMVIIIRKQRSNVL